MGEVPGPDGTVLVELRRPFPAQSLGFKIQTQPQPQPRQGGFSQAMVVAFINARHVAERLNHVVPGAWSDRYLTPPAPLATGLVCELTISGVTRSDIGFSSNLTTDIGVKSLYSDAFKRAAVKWGVGVSLYAMPRMYVPANELTQRGSGDRIKWFLPDRTVQALRGRYGQWLDQYGAKEFGDPLGHGDAEDPTGDPETVEEQERATPAGGKVPDSLEFVRAAIRAKDKKLLKDDEWAAIRAEHDRAGKLDALAKQLAGTYADIGGDVDALRAQYEALKAAA